MDPTRLAGLLGAFDRIDAPGPIPQPEAQIAELEAWRAHVGAERRCWKQGDLCRMRPGVGNVKEVLKPQIVWMYWRDVDMKSDDMHLLTMAQADRATMTTLPYVDCMIGQWRGEVGCIVFQLFWTAGLEPWVAK